MGQSQFNESTNTRAATRLLLFLQTGSCQRVYKHFRKVLGLFLCYFAQAGTIKCSCPTCLCQLYLSYLHKGHRWVSAMPWSVVCSRWQSYLRATESGPADRVSGSGLSKHTSPADYHRLCDSPIHEGPAPSSSKEQSARISTLPDCLRRLIVSMDRAAPTWLQVWPLPSLKCEAVINIPRPNHNCRIQQCP